MDTARSCNSSRRAPGLGGFFILWTGQALSLLGSQAVQFALIWWLARETGSGRILALAALVGILPTVLAGPVIGALVDRWNRKRIMALADGAVAVVSLILVVAFDSSAATPGIVLAALFARAIGGAFHAPAMLASTSLMVPASHLARVQGMNQALEGGMLIVSAPLGALLVAWLPMAGVMAVDVVTAAFALVPLLFVPVPQPQLSASGNEQGAAKGPLRQLASEVREGFAYIGRNRGHLGLLGLAALVNFCLPPAFSLLPLLVAETGGNALRLGSLNSAFGVGSIMGGLLLAGWGGFRRRIHTSLAGFIGLGIATLAIGAAPAEPFAASLAAVLAVGVMVPLVSGPILSILQATVAPEYQGRVFTLYGSLAALSAPFGLAAAGPIADLLGVRFWYLLGGIACLAASAIGFLVPAIVRLEDGTEEISTPEAV